MLIDEKKLMQEWRDALQGDGWHAEDGTFNGMPAVIIKNQRFDGVQVSDLRPPNPEAGWQKTSDNQMYADLPCAKTYFKYNRSAPLQDGVVTKLTVKSGLFGKKAMFTGHKAEDLNKDKKLMHWMEYYTDGGLSIQYSSKDNAFYIRDSGSFKAAPEEVGDEAGAGKTAFKAEKSKVGLSIGKGGIGLGASKSTMQSKTISFGSKDSGPVGSGPLRTHSTRKNLEMYERLLGVF